MKSGGGVSARCALPDFASLEPGDERSIERRPRTAQCLMPARRFLPSMRRSRDALVGLVARRLIGTAAARRMRSMSRSRASARLRAWVRWRCAMMTRTPSRVSRVPASRSSRARVSADNDGEPRTSKRSCTAVASLLTFCPPGPEARTKLSSISRSSMLIWALTRIISASVARIERQRNREAAFATLAGPGIGFARCGLKGSRSSKRDPRDGRPR